MKFAERKLVAAAYVGDIRAVTVCVDCGEQPVEFHRDEHVANPEWRIATLVMHGASVARIEAEIKLSIPVCRRCHMLRDGRLEQLVTRARPIGPPKPCGECMKPEKPLRRGLCGACYARRRRPVPLSPEERSYRKGSFWREINTQGWKRRQVSASKLRAPRSTDGRFIRRAS